MRWIGNMTEDEVRALVQRAILRGWIRMRGQARPPDQALALAREAWARIEELRKRPGNRDTMKDVDRDVLIPRGWAIGREMRPGGAWYVELTGRGLEVTSSDVEAELLRE